MISADGTTEYSHIVVLYQAGSHTEVQIFPNPTTGRVQLIAAERNQPIQVFDALGRLVRSEAAIPAELDLSDLPAGTYHVRVSGQTLRIVKQ